MPRDFWLDEHDQELVALRGEGHSFTICQAKINRKFGTDYSRNACIGRAVRLGISHTAEQLRVFRARAASEREQAKQEKLSRDDKSAPSQRKRRRARYGIKMAAAPVNEQEVMGISPRALVRELHITGAPTVELLMKRRLPTPEQSQPDFSPPRCVEVEPLKMALVELEPHHCRYPVGGWPSDDPITFCGHPKRGNGSSYCAAHADLVHGDRRGRHEMTDETRAIHRKLLRPNIITLKRDFSGEAEAV